MPDVFDRLIAAAAPHPARATLSIRSRARFEAPASSSSEGAGFEEREAREASDRRRADAAARRPAENAVPEPPTQVDEREGAEGRTPRNPVAAAPEPGEAGSAPSEPRSLSEDRKQAPGTARDLGDDPLARSARPVPERTVPTAATSSPRSTETASHRVVSAAELLAEHIAPALRDGRLLSPREVAQLVAVAPGDERRPRSDGRSPVGLEAVEVAATADVHVHIDRIEIRHAPPPAPVAAPPAARPPGTEHDEYLGRQRRRWG